MKTVRLSAGKNNGRTLEIKVGRLGRFGVGEGGGERKLCSDFLTCLAHYLNSENKILFLSIFSTPNTVLVFAQYKHNA